MPYTFIVKQSTIYIYYTYMNKATILATSAN